MSFDLTLRITFFSHKEIFQKPVISTGENNSDSIGRIFSLIDLNAATTTTTKILRQGNIGKISINIMVKVLPEVLRDDITKPRFKKKEPRQRLQTSLSVQ